MNSMVSYVHNLNEGLGSSEYSTIPFRTKRYKLVDLSGRLVGLWDGVYWVLVILFIITWEMHGLLTLMVPQ